MLYLAWIITTIVAVAVGIFATLRLDHKDQDPEDS